jgi:hypothetical protein
MGISYGRAAATIIVIDQKGLIQQFFQQNHPPTYV